jgi:hypothetical protein
MKRVKFYFWKRLSHKILVISDIDQGPNTNLSRFVT